MRAFLSLGLFALLVPPVLGLEPFIEYETAEKPAKVKDGDLSWNFEKRLTALEGKVADLEKRIDKVEKVTTKTVPPADVVTGHAPGQWINVTEPVCTVDARGLRSCVPVTKRVWRPDVSATTLAPSMVASPMTFAAPLYSMATSQPFYAQPTFTSPTYNSPVQSFGTITYGTPVITQSVPMRFGRVFQGSCPTCPR